MNTPERHLILHRELHAHTRIPGAYQARQDMEAIFGRRSRLSAFGVLRISPGRNDPRPRFGLAVVPDRESDSLNVGMGDVSEAGRAAGWAVLRMYCDKLNMPLESLWVRDLDPATIRAYSAIQMEFLGEFFANEEGENVTALNFVQMFQVPDAPTTVMVDNSPNETLPDILEKLRKGYVAIRPELGADRISSLIGGVVGAREFEEFRDTWLEVSVVHDNPVDSARALLESGIFLRPNE